MKKVLAMILALVLILGMTTVAFAEPGGGQNDGATIQLGELMCYNQKSKELDRHWEQTGADLPANCTYAYVVYDGKTGEPITDLAWLQEHYKVTANIRYGKAYIAHVPNFQLIEVSNFVGLAPDQPVAAIVFSTADRFQMERMDYEMKISIYPDLDHPNDFGFADESNVDENGVYRIELAGETGYEVTVANTFTTMDYSAPIVSFKKVYDDPDGTVELYFEGYYYGTDVTVVAIGRTQKDLFLRLEEDVPEALKERYPSADLRAVFFAGNNKMFRKKASIRLEAEPIVVNDEICAPYIYYYEDGKITAPVDAKYDITGQTFWISTNTLGDYIISDKPLSIDTANKPGKSRRSSSSTEESRQEYWAGIKEKVGSAKAGDTIRASLESGEMMPAAVIDTLKGKNVNLLVSHQDSDYLLNGNRLNGYNAAAVYYTASEVIAMASSTPASGQTPGNTQSGGAVYNPETGGELPAEYVQETILPVEAAPATAEMPLMGSHNNWGWIAMILVPASVVGILFWHKKREY